MDRRKALTFAGAGALVLTTAGAALAANVGLLGAASGDDTGVGQLEAGTIGAYVATEPVTTLPPEPQVVVVDEWVTVGGAGGADATAPGQLADDAASANSGVPAPDAGAALPGPRSASPTTRSAGTYHEDEDEDHEDEDHEREDHEDEDHEREDEHEDHEDDD